MLLIFAEIVDHHLHRLVGESTVLKSDVPNRLVVISIYPVGDDTSDYFLRCDFVVHFDVLKADVCPVLSS